MKRKRRNDWSQLESGLYVPPLLLQHERLPLANPIGMDRGMGRRCCCVVGESCVFCSGNTPEEWLVELDGIQAGGEACCGGFNDYNDNFVVSSLTFDNDFNFCYWSHDFSSPICSTQTLVLTIRALFDAIQVAVYTVPSIGWALWPSAFNMFFANLYPGASVSCNEFSSEELFQDQLAPYCIITSATCFVTAL